MRSILSERNVVVVLFVMVLITFSLAQEDSKKMEQMYSGKSIPSNSRQVIVQQPGKDLKNTPVTKATFPLFTAE